MTLQHGDRIEFSFWEAGCMIWVGSLDAYETFCRAWDWREGDVVMSDPEMVRKLVLEHQVIMPMSLYQDDGYVTRVVLGELDERAQADWTARVRWQLNLPSGKLVVSGIVDSDEEVPALVEADPDDLLQCYVDVPPGKYAVTVYAYPPGDLSTGWMQIAKPGLFQSTPGIEPENPLLYFRRTRPGEAIPDWLGEDYAETEAERKRYMTAFREGDGYVSFIVQLLPLTIEPPVPQLEEDGCLIWEFRKPEQCPLGVPVLSQGDAEDEG